MNIVVAYDVNTETREGRRRLRKVAKACEGFGQRVQYSVFECSLADTDFERFRRKLLGLIDTDQDSLRIYTLRGRREEVVQVWGRDGYIDFRAPLVV